MRDYRAADHALSEPELLAVEARWGFALDRLGYPRRGGSRLAVGG